MNKESKSIIKKTVKIAGVTCIALGGAALIASGAALKAMTEGAKYLKDTVKKIVGEEPDADVVVEEAPTEVVVEAPVAEAVVEEVSADPIAVEADFVEAESQEA